MWGYPQLTRALDGWVGAAYWGISGRGGWVWDFHLGAKLSSKSGTLINGLICGVG